MNLIEKIEQEEIARLTANKHFQVLLLAIRLLSALTS